MCTSQIAINFGNVKDTREKGGKAPPCVTLEDIVEDLSEYFEDFCLFKQTKKEIKRKYFIQKAKTRLWQEDDIKRAWGKTQRMVKNSRRRKLWSLAIILQIIQRKEKSEYDVSKMTESASDNFVEENKSEFFLPFERRDKMIERNQERTTLEKKGRAPPEITLKELTQSLCLYVNQLHDPIKAKGSIENKYGIKTQDNDLWKDDDIKRAWGKTQRMRKKSSRRKFWSLVIMLQIIQSQESVCDVSKMKESASDDFVEEAAVNRPEFPLPFETSDNTEGGQEGRSAKNKFPMDKHTKPKKGVCKAKMKKTIPKRSKNNSTIQKQTEQKRTDPQSQTLYIQIPLSEMCNVTNTSSNPDNRSRLKLIEGFPLFTHTLVRTSYVMLYDNRTRNAAWVFEILSNDTLKKNSERTSNYLEDISVHEYFRGQNSISNDSNGEFESGHLAAAANHQWCQQAMNDTFLFSNISPQTRDLNRTVWKTLEDYCRRIGEKNNVYVYTGPLYCPGGENENTFQCRIVAGKAVPTHFFKVVILENKNKQLELECYIIPNVNAVEDANEGAKEGANEGEVQNIESKEKKLEEMKKKLEPYQVDLMEIEQESGLLFHKEQVRENGDVIKDVVWRSHTVACTKVPITNITE